MSLRHAATVLFMACAGCTFAVAPHKTSTNQGMMALWLVPDEEPDAIAHDELRLNVPWADARAEVKKRLEDLGLRLRKTTPTRMRFTLPVEENKHVEVEAISAANGQATRVVVRRGLDSEAAAGVATKVRRVMKSFAVPASPPAPPPTSAPLPPTSPPSASVPLPPPMPPSTSAPKTLSVQEAMERPLAPFATPPPEAIAPPSAKPHRGRRRSKSIPPR